MKKQSLKQFICMTMALVLLAGCGEASSTDQEKSSTETQVSEQVTDQTESSATDGQEAEESQKSSKYGDLLEIKSRNKRYSEAYKLLKPNLTDLENHLEDNLELLWIMVGCRNENTLDQVLLSKEEINDVKSKVMEKVKEHNGESAIVCFDVYVSKDKTTDAYYVFDDQDRLVYENGMEGHIYEEYALDSSTWTNLYADEAAFAYNTDGYLESIHIRLLPNLAEMSERTDRVEYNEHGWPIGIWKGNKLETFDDVEYNEDGLVTKYNGREIVYREDGFLGKISGDEWVEEMTFDDGQKFKFEYKPFEFALSEYMEAIRWDISAVQWSFEISTARYGSFGKVDYADDEEKNFALPEYMTFVMPEYNKKLEGKEVIYNISMPKDLGDGFVEYAQYGIQYNQLGELESIGYNGHVLCYLPGKLQN